MRRLFGMALAAAVFIGTAWPSLAQDATPVDDGAASWRTAGATAGRGASAALPGPAHLSDSSPAAPPSVSAVASLPNDAGQVWRDYDLSAYTARVTSTKRPELAVLDWILRETGYEAWHTEPLGVLSVGSRGLRVYHTPAMQKIVADVVDRFTSSEAASYTFAMRLATLDSPSWRASAQRLLRPVPVQTPGVNAWLLPKENAAILVGELRRRSDYREHSSPYLIVNNGQSTVVSSMRARQYVRDAVPRLDAASGYELSMGQVEEGFAIEFSPLLSLDRRAIDAILKCEINQVEKMHSVTVDVPTAALPRQRTKIESPQMSHYRFHERFRWPIDEVLVVGLGMVALPIPVDGARLTAGVPLPLGASPARADMLIFVECKGPTAPAASGLTAAPSDPAREAKNYRGRY